MTGLEWWTEANITASFVYDGETYSDSVRVCVREYDLEVPLMHEDYWNDPGKWIEVQEYFGSSRKTYKEYNARAGMFQDGGVDLKYNPDDTNTSIYLRLVPAPITLDESKDYYLEVFHDIAGNVPFNFEFNGGVLDRDGWENNQLIPATEDVGYFLLKPGTRTDRLCMIQVRAESTPTAQSKKQLSFAIVSKPKL